MADQKISELNAASSVTGTDEFVIVQSGANFKATAAQIASYIGAGSGTVTSVAASVPTGLTISGSPITTSGTLAFGLDTGYVIPLQSTIDAKLTANAPITGATKTKITYDADGLVTSGADATTADIADSTDKRYVTDAYLAVLGNTSGTNTGDQNLSGLVPYTGATGDVTLGTNKLTAVALQANSSAGGELRTNSAAVAVHWGSGGSANGTLYGGWNYDAGTANTLVSLGASKTITSLDTATYPSLTEIAYVKGVTSAVQTQLNAKAAAAFATGFGVTIDGGGVAITTGSKGYIIVPFAMTITGWTITGDQSGSIVVDVKRSTYSGFPTTSSIAGTEKPTLSSAQKNEDAALSSWTTSIAAGDVIEFVVDSAATVQRVNVTIYGTRA